MKKPRLKLVTLPDGTSVYCRNRDEVRGVRSLAQEYFTHGIELGAGAVVFDVGANIGLFALEAAKRGAIVHAFEPMPVTFAALEANAPTVSQGKIHPQRLALGVRKETATFNFFPLLSALSTRFPDSVHQNGPIVIEHVMDDPKLVPRAGWFRKAPRFLRRAVVGLIARFLFTSRPVQCSVETVSQQIESLSIPRVTLLKIDVEGAEMDVLQGIAEADWPKIEQVVAEIHDENGRLEAIKQLLTQHGMKKIVAELEPDVGQFGIYLLWARRPA